MTVRAKFRCNEVKLSEHGAEVTLRPVVGNSDENARFYKATPGGQIQLSTINEQAAAQFKPGRDYYVDFTPADQPQAA